MENLEEIKKYNEMLEKIEDKLEKHLNDILNDSIDKNVKAEQYVVALKAGHEYVIKKLQVCIAKELKQNEENKNEVNNEG